MDRIHNVASNKLSISQYFDFWWIEERSNRVFVFLNKFDDGVIAEFKQTASDSPAIEFKQSPGRIQTEASLSPGQLISGTMSTPSSVGYRVTRYGQHGVIMAGHTTFKNEVFRVNGINVAKCEISSGFLLLYNYLMKEFKYLELILICLFFSCKESNHTKEKIIENKNVIKNIKSDKQGNAEQAVQEPAFNDYQEIKKLFGNGDKLRLLKTKDYPSYYGGSYTNKKGQLIIFITGDTLKAKEIFSERTNKTNTIFQSCEYSYRTLNKIMDTISYKTNNKIPTSKYLDYWWIEEKENRVFVFLNKLNDEVISEFKQNIIDSPAIVFKKSSGRIVYD
ncbi:hypothetical protein M1P97_09455 [Parabacteroides sp. GYB001]|uniref:hypothetical protein n=1 Tax=Parabacteroides leei TaxID=2939491 RepID=UPI00201821E3|nr:hypothetical protein [Parabacteroides leei]MCL3851512.1 hypothetical protein [Parabacteroides leei]